MMAAHLLAICLFFVLQTFVSGSCTQWGQSCWGGHGKRSSASDWYMSRLLAAQRRYPDLLAALSPSHLSGGSFTAHRASSARQRSLADEDRNIFGAENIVMGPSILAGHSRTDPNTSDTLEPWLIQQVEENGEEPMLVEGEPRLMEGEPRLVEGEPRLMEGESRLVEGEPRFIKEVEEEPRVIRVPKFRLYELLSG